MKIIRSIQKAPAGLLTAVVLAAAATTAAHAAAPALQGQLVLRPLTPQDVKDYSLGSAQTASGLTTVAINNPLYFEAFVNSAVPTADITNVAWSITASPIGSAVVLTNSPLGTNVPIWAPTDVTRSKIAGPDGRIMLRPDVAGQYTVRVVVSTASSGSTNISMNITAGTYMGAAVCALCHSGSQFAEDTYTPWLGTKHSHAFKDAIDGISTDHFSKNCISCHSLGFDNATNSNNGGFDDVAAQTGWVFPTTFTNGNWNAMPAALRGVANVQCENCHGPGSEHAAAFGNTNLANWPRLSVSYSAGNCAQCHDSLSHHVKTREWKASRHAVATRTPSGPTRFNCVRCHTAAGFEGFIEHAGNTNTYTTNTVYEAITCAACHDPHDASNPFQLRAANQYTLPEGTTITNVGGGALCMTCHHSRNGDAVTNIANYKVGKPTWAGGSSFGVHDSTAGDMIAGVNAITYGKQIPSGSHGYIEDICVGCHMQEVPTTSPAFGQAGGHTFSMTYNVVNGGVTNTLDAVEVCIKCHGEIEEFNMVRQDYDGDGLTQGVQTEVQNLLNKLSRLLPNSTYRADGQYVADGLIKSPSAKTNWQDKFLKAAWNWQFVNVEGSHGIHNTPYAVGVLKASIADLTGDANMDGLPDDWQVQYFGSTTNLNSAPNASPAGDGIPNWLKFTLGLNPLIKGLQVPDGVVWANGNSIGGSTNTVHIYTAAEIAFDTEVGKTYQIQGVSTLGGGWQNIGTPIPGTGSAISYVTPTRAKAQQFYRVMTTP